MSTSIKRREPAQDKISPEPVLKEFIGSLSNFIGVLSEFVVLNEASKHPDNREIDRRKAEEIAGSVIEEAILLVGPEGGARLKEEYVKIISENFEEEDQHEK